jgi:hypothetical protein
MDIPKIKNLNECLLSIDAMEKTCRDRFTPKVCENIQFYYRNYCYNKFANNATCSSESICGDKTLNLSIKSPPPFSL